MIGSQAGVKSAAIGPAPHRDPGEELSRIPLRPPDWTTDASCTDHPPEWWYSEEPADEAHAVEVCNSCPVREMCALGALERGEPHGVWGGLTVDAREWIARSDGIYPRPKAAKHGTRSKYVAGCDAGFGGEPCQPCRRSHADYEHQRRLRASATPRKGLAPSDPFPSTPDRAREGWDPRPASADGRFLDDVEAAEVGIEDTWRDDETAIELGRMVCRADAAGMSEADLRGLLTGAGLNLRQASALLRAARAAYGTLPAEPALGRRRVRRRRQRALVSA